MMRRKDWMNEGAALHITASVFSAFAASVLATPADFVMCRWQVASPDVTMPQVHTVSSFSTFKYKWDILYT